jgi:hypothetical protein
MTRREIVQRAADWKRFSSWTSLVLLVLLMGGLGVMAVHQHSTPREQDDWQHLYLIIPALFLGTLIALIVMPIRGGRKYGFRCPHCAAFISPFKSEISFVIASGRCSCCGGNLITDEADSDTTNSLRSHRPSINRTRAQLVESMNAVAKEQNRFVGLTFLVWVAVFGGSYVFERLGRPVPKELPVSLVASLLIVLFLTGVILFWVVGSGSRRHGLVCTHCGKPVYAKYFKIAASAGRCPSCGEPLICDL